MGEEERLHHERRRQGMVEYARKCGADTAEKVYLLFRSDITSDMAEHWPGGSNDAEIMLVIEMMGLTRRVDLRMCWRKSLH